MGGQDPGLRGGIQTAAFPRLCRVRRRPAIVRAAQFGSPASSGGHSGRAAGLGRALRGRRG
ncbi:Hypothetical Protein RSKD131_3379 [Cereibacter sphaeroides KD131]|nr:Hypothetical Protein RSKD131_3379 [Cereibacter sphaeroides KD131]